MDSRSAAVAIGTLAVVVVVAAAFGLRPPVEERYVLEGQVNESGENLTIGIAGSSEPIDFGVLPPEGASSERTVEVGNPGGKPARLQFHLGGNISDYMRVDPADGVEVPPGGRANITLTFRPENAAEGYYRGSLTVRRQGWWQ